MMIDVILTENEKYKYAVVCNNKVLLVLDKEHLDDLYEKIDKVRDREEQAVN